MALGNSKRLTLESQADIAIVAGLEAIDAFYNCHTNHIRKMPELMEKLAAARELAVAQVEAARKMVQQRDEASRQPESAPQAPALTVAKAAALLDNFGHGQAANELRRVFDAAQIRPDQQVEILDHELAQDILLAIGGLYVKSRKLHEFLARVAERLASGLLKEYACLVQKAQATFDEARQARGLSQAGLHNRARELLCQARELNFSPAGLAALERLINEGRLPPEVAPAAVVLAKEAPGRMRSVALLRALRARPEYEPREHEPRQLVSSKRLLSPAQRAKRDTDRRARQLKRASETNTPPTLNGGKKGKK